MKKVILCFLLTGTGLLLSGQTVRLSREKQILLVHNIDSLIKKYELYSTLSEGNKISENQKEVFLKIFQSDTVIVFDDITPNYINNNETTINEKQKKVSDYVKDISDNYSNLYCGITETDAGTLYSRIRRDNVGLVVTIKIKKETQASAKNGSGARYETTTFQDLVLRIKDTISCEPVISGIAKSGLSKWNYVPPFSKVSPFEMILSLKAGLVNLKYGSQQSYSIISGAKMASRPGFGLEGEFRYLFKNYESYKIGGSVGLGVSYLTSSYFALGYISVSDQTDKDNDTYYQIIELSSLTEKNSIIGINVPVKLSYEKSFSLTNGFFMNAGAILSYYNGSYNTKTNYTSSGYYPKYNVLLQEIPSYGFNKNQAFSAKGKLPLNPINVAGNIELGMFFRLQNKYQLYFGLNYYQAFLNFASKNKSPAILTLNQTDPSKTPVYNSIFAEMGNVNLSVIGITVGIKKLAVTAKTQKIVNYLKL